MKKIAILLTSILMMSCSRENQQRQIKTKTNTLKDKNKSVL